MMPAFMPNASDLANILWDAREKVRHGSYSEGDPTYSFCCAQQSELMKGYLAVIDLCLRMLGHLISHPLPSIPPSLHPELTWPFHHYQPFFFKIALPNHPRQSHPTYDRTMGVHRSGIADLLYQSLFRTGLVHCHLCAGYLPAQPLPGLLAAQV